MTIVQMGRITATENGDRNAVALGLPTDGTQLGILQGVQSGMTLTKTSGMGWQLDLGRCVIAPATAANGPVVATITVAETGSFAAGDATRDRIDVVGLQIDETATSGNGNPPVKSVVIQGAYPASGSPVPPAIPAGTIGLAQVKIAAGTSAGGGGWNTANLTDIRPNNRIKHAEYSVSGFAVSAGTAWDVGALVADNSKTWNNTFVQPDATSGTVQILENGIYSIDQFSLPRANPGASYAIMRDVASGNSLSAAGQPAGLEWELFTTVTNLYLTAGQKIIFRLWCSQATTIDSRVRIHQIARAL